MFQNLDSTRDKENAVYLEISRRLPQDDILPKRLEHALLFASTVSIVARESNSTHIEASRVVYECRTVMKHFSLCDDAIREWLESLDQ